MRLRHLKHLLIDLPTVAELFKQVAYDRMTDLKALFVQAMLELAQTHRCPENDTFWIAKSLSFEKIPQCLEQAGLMFYSGFPAAARLADAAHSLRRIRRGDICFSRKIRTGHNARADSVSVL